MRHVVFVSDLNKSGWKCSDCEWVFQPSRSMAGRTLAEIRQNFDRDLEEKFIEHVCAEHPKK